MLRSRHRPLVATAAALAVAVALAACSEQETSTGKVTITVMGQPAATNKAALELFQQQVAEFEAANPGIDVVASDVPWDAKTFTARLAGGNAPTVVRVPLTE